MIDFVSLYRPPYTTNFELDIVKAYSLAIKIILPFSLLHPRIITIGYYWPGANSLRDHLKICMALIVRYRRGLSAVSELIFVKRKISKLRFNN